jgi:UDP-2-acetamido-2-deoxy-ribo-hexuluronate aminotransferase
MKFVDLQFENKNAKLSSKNSFKLIEKTGKYLLGEYLENFENQFAKDQDKKYCIGVKNATDALAISFKALGSENRTVIIPQFGAYPTVMAAIQANSKNIIAAPVDETLCLNLEDVKIPDNSIIVPVNLFGNESNLTYLRKRADETNSHIVEDCAQSTGIPNNNLSDVSIHSFYPTKPLGCQGDGGAILTNDERIAKFCKQARFYGLNDGIIDSWGFNSRMDEWQSCFLTSKLSYYRNLNDTRKENANLYNQILNKSIRYTENCVYHQYVSLWKDRKYIQKKLSEKGIPTMIHYPKMLIDMPYLRDKVKFVNECPRVSDYILSIPVGPHLTNQNIKKIKKEINSLKSNLIDFKEI